MSKVHVSRRTISAKGRNTIYIHLRNNNEVVDRHFRMKAYGKQSQMKDAIPIYSDNKRIQTDRLAPGEVKQYRIDVSNVSRRMVLEIYQHDRTGMRLIRSRKNDLLEMQLK